MKSLRLRKEPRLYFAAARPRLTRRSSAGCLNCEQSCRYGIGVDTVDLAECTRRGIYVANVPDYCIEEVATHALTLILNWSRKLPIARQIIPSGVWGYRCVTTAAVAAGLSSGHFWGFGRIAQALCRMSRAIGCQVWVRDPYVEKSHIQKRGDTTGFA